MNSTEWVIMAGIMAWPLCWLLQPWRWAAFRALATHPPLAPYEPPWWWIARLMRFSYLAWRLIIFIQALFLSAIVAIGIDDQSSSTDIQQWMDSGWRMAIQFMAFLWFGLAFDLAFHVWRITNQNDWQFSRRSFAELYLPACVLGIVLWTIWSVATDLDGA